MIIILLIVIAILVASLIVQYRSGKAKQTALHEIRMKLQQIVAEESGESILRVTDDEELRELLTATNQLLEYARNTAAKYTRAELETKKMISNLSHDLKTPLTVVLGYIETLHVNPGMDAEERTLMLAKVHKKTLEVLELIHQFFALARLEAGDEDLPLSRLQLNEICRHNLLAFYEILTAKGFEVHIEIPDESIFVFGNEEALNRVLSNLISNAIQHGGDGNVIGIKLVTEHSSAIIEVWDRGKGIREQHYDRIFERMYTLEDSRNKSYHNSGLGLTITKRLVEKIGGTIEVISHPHERTAFIVKLNLFSY